VPRVVDHAAERTELARRSRDLFARHGYAGLSMRKAAEGLGVSTGTLYHYFDSKEHLFAAVVDATIDADVFEAVARLPVIAVPRPLRLRAIFRYAETSMPRLVRHYRVFVEYATQTKGAPAQELIGRSRERYLQAVADVLNLGRREADLVLLTLCGLILRSMCGDPGTDVEDVCRALDPLLETDA
jgi:AcrR family transcriptional regulator